MKYFENHLYFTYMHMIFLKGVSIHCYKLSSRHRNKSINILIILKNASTNSGVRIQQISLFEMGYI